MKAELPAPSSFVLRRFEMTKFQTRSLLLILLAVASVLLLAFGQSPVLSPVWNAVQVPLAAVQRGIAELWAGVSHRLEVKPEVDALEQRIAELQGENARLEAENIQLRENESELRILSGLVEYARTQPDAKYLTANLIGRDTSPLLSFLIFDRGSDDGVIRGMPVVSAEGLVGRVVEVSPQACKIQPITDPASAIAARLQTSREAGVVVGQLGGGLEMQFITQQTQVEPGEVVVTSGLGGV
jgi:rod shape-determining protein MreC